MYYFTQNIYLYGSDINGDQLDKAQENATLSRTTISLFQADLLGYIKLSVRSFQSSINLNVHKYDNIFQ